MCVCARACVASHTAMVADEEAQAVTSFRGDAISCRLLELRSKFDMTNNSCCKENRCKDFRGFADAAEPCSEDDAGD